MELAISDTYVQFMEAMAEVVQRQPGFGICLNDSLQWGIHLISEYVVNPRATGWLLVM